MVGLRTGLSAFLPAAADAGGMDLSDLVDSLKRAVAVPGEFDTYFTEATTNDLAGVLADAVAECQLDGFLGQSTLSASDLTVEPELTSPQSALVILYAMTRMLQARVLNLRNRTRYKAGNVEAETEQSATVLVELLKEAQVRKQQLLNDARAGNLAGAFAMVDMYVAKSIDTSRADLDYAIGSVW